MVVAEKVALFVKKLIFDKRENFDKKANSILLKMNIIK